MKKKITALLLAIMAAGCAQMPEDAFSVSTEQLARRQVETRRYDGIKESELYVASSNVLQDMGYTLEFSEVKLGLLTANKQREAVTTEEVVGTVLLAVFTGRISNEYLSKDQNIRVSLVVRPVLDSKGTPISDKNYVRVNFQRIVRKQDNRIYTETLDDPELYQGFHEKLSKSVFLEAQKI